MSGADQSRQAFFGLQVLVAILAATGALEVKVYRCSYRFEGADLRLMSPVTHLHYTPSFELMPHARQILEGSLLTTHCFDVMDGVHGLVVWGHTLQKFDSFLFALRCRIPKICSIP